MEQLYFIVIILMFLPSLIAILGILYLLLDNPVTIIVNLIAVKINIFIKKFKLYYYE
jgi:hypothetical protein